MLEINKVWNYGNGDNGWVQYGVLVDISNISYEDFNNYYKIDSKNFIHLTDTDKLEIYVDGKKVESVFLTITRATLYRSLALSGFIHIEKRHEKKFDDMCDVITMIEALNL